MTLKSAPGLSISVRMTVRNVVARAGAVPEPLSDRLRGGAQRRRSLRAPRARPRPAKRIGHNARHGWSDDPRHDLRRGHAPPVRRGVRKQLPKATGRPGSDGASFAPGLEIRVTHARCNGQRRWTCSRPRYVGGARAIAQPPAAATEKEAVAAGTRREVRSRWEIRRSRLAVPIMRMCVPG